MLLAVVGFFPVLPCSMMFPPEVPMKWLGVGAVLVGVALGAQGGEVVQTEGRFAKVLGEQVGKTLRFSGQGKLVRIEARPGGTLPLESVAGQGMQECDGVLAVGEQFGWPGCGIDRTSYEVKEVGEASVVIKYRRGMAQVDGYHDEGEFSVGLGDPRQAAGGGGAAEGQAGPGKQELPYSLSMRIRQMERGTREIQEWPANKADLFQGLRKQLPAAVESEKGFREAIATIPKELLDGRRVSTTLEANGWYYASVDTAGGEGTWFNVIAVKKGSREMSFSDSW